MVLGQPGEGGLDVEADVRAEHVVVWVDRLRAVERDDQRRRRSWSRQALTTMRCSQVDTAESPRNEPARRKAEMKASWTQSAASSRSPVVRSATAHIRSRWRRKISSKAAGSPATWSASSSVSERS